MFIGGTIGVEVNSAAEFAGHVDSVAVCDSRSCSACPTSTRTGYSGPTVTAAGMVFGQEVCVFVTGAAVGALRISGAVGIKVDTAAENTGNVNGVVTIDG